MEHVEIRLHMTMDHREAQESPTTEIARVMRGIANRLADGDLIDYETVQTIGGDNIGEVEMRVTGGDA